MITKEAVQAKEVSVDVSDSMDLVIAKIVSPSPLTYLEIIDIFRDIANDLEEDYKNGKIK